MPPAQARQLLDTLVGAHLLEQTDRDRWQFHDLLRAYALDQTHHHETADEQQAALRRILSWYVHTSAAVEQHNLENGLPRVMLEKPSTDIQPLRFSAYNEATEWFQSERVNLIAAMQAGTTAGLDRAAWQIHGLLREQYVLQWLFEDWVTGGHIALQAARRSGDGIGISHILISLGMACRQRHRLAESANYLREAHASYQQSGDDMGTAWTLNLLGIVAIENHHMADAYQYLEESMALYRSTGHEVFAALPLSNLGWACERFGQPSDAIDICQRAIGPLQKGGDPAGVTGVFRVMALAYVGLGLAERAVEHAEAGLAEESKSLAYARCRGSLGARSVTLKPIEY